MNGGISINDKAEDTEISEFVELYNEDEPVLLTYTAGSITPSEIHERFAN